MTSSTTAAPRSKWREGLDYFLWFYTPFKSMSASDIYELVSTNAYSGKGLYLNLGYWKTARTIDEACVDMAMLVANSAGVGAGDKVVDVGFGFGDQDMLWMERLGPAHITGLNITSSQVKLARERVRERGLADRIDLREGSATAMPLPNAAFDKVVGVECAFHFDTREAFFHEAHRVLKPGGRLALADVIMADPDPRAFQRKVQRFNWNFFMKKYAVPEANADTKETYAAKLRAAAHQCQRPLDPRRGLSRPACLHGEGQEHAEALPLAGAPALPHDAEVQGRVGLQRLRLHPRHGGQGPRSLTRSSFGGLPSLVPGARGMASMLFVNRPWRSPRSPLGYGPVGCRWHKGFGPEVPRIHRHPTP